MRLLILLAGLAWSADATVPGRHHERLADFAGTWDIHARFWRQPETAPHESAGTAELRLILGGRFLEQRQEGRHLGKPTSGVGYVGFDNTKGRYVSLWLDDLSTAIMRTEGPPDPSGKAIRTRGTIDDAASGKPLRIEEVMTLVGPDRFTYEAWIGPPEGKLVRVMEIVYSRRRL
ncbi:MAG: DUF1579 domain-containing protein [Elusimicrobia bacterium]|nr:DUF1579 domain-containing protein [Elusimicrobiota bacterium]